MVRGTVSVDFVGDRDEALKYVKKHSIRFPHPLTMGRGGAERSPNGDLQLFARYKSNEELQQVISEFDDLGWDFGSCLISRWALPGRSRRAS